MVSVPRPVLAAFVAGVVAAATAIPVNIARRVVRNELETG
jgi:hypothetical protein